MFVLQFQIYITKTQKSSNHPLRTITPKNMKIRRCSMIATVITLLHACKEGCIYPVEELALSLTFFSSTCTFLRCFVTFICILLIDLQKFNTVKLFSLYSITINKTLTVQQAIKALLDKCKTNHT